MSFETRPWPIACRDRLLDLLALSPPPSPAEIGRIISAMPEAREAGLAPSSNAVNGKIKRLRHKHYAVPAAKPSVIKSK